MSLRMGTFSLEPSLLSNGIEIGAEIKSITLKNINITIFGNLIFLSSSEGSYESAHVHTLTALR